MPKCPNCGQETARTGDWACQWCGYPLLSRSYKKIPKTYKELKEEELHKQKPLVREETEPEPMVETEPEPVVETEPEPMVETKPEAVVETEPEAVAETKPEPVGKRKPVARRKPVAKRRPVAKRKPKLAPEPEPVAETKPEAVAEPEPEPILAAIELTVEELLSAYRADGAAADAKFTNKTLKITGIVGRIEIKDILDIHYITLAGAAKPLLQAVRCTFHREHGPELSQLTTGQTVTVQGKYDGSIIDISMRDCVLVN